MLFFFSSRRRHTRCSRVWSSDVCSSDLVDLRHEPKPTGKHFAIGPTLETAMKKTLKDKGQIILLLNRRGFSTHVHCQACGQIGRASCRERVWMSVVVVSVKKKRMRWEVRDVVFFFKQKTAYEM